MPEVSEEVQCRTSRTYCNASYLHFQGHHLILIMACLACFWLPGLRASKGLQSPASPQGKRTDYHCSYGLEDFRVNLPSSQALSAGKRNGKVSKGLSVKRGCKASFAIITKQDEPTAEIRILEDSRSNHGDSAAEEGRHKTQPYLSGEIRFAV